MGTELSTQAERTTLKQALLRYLREVTPGKKGRALEARRVKSWMQHPLAQRRLSELRAAEFANYRDEELARGKPGNTVRLELALIRVLYKVAAREWGMQGLENPVTGVALSLSARKRRLAGDEEQRLLAQLKASGTYFAPLAELALESGMRQAELLSLTAEDVDLEHRIANVRDPHDAKTRAVPLSTRATQIIRALPKPKSLVAPLFPVSRDSVIRSFRKACDQAGIGDLSFHDLRHEAIARICARLPMQRALRVIGYKTPAMLMRYYDARRRSPSLRRWPPIGTCASWWSKTTGIPRRCCRSFWSFADTPSRWPTAARKAWRPRRARRPISCCAISAFRTATATPLPKLCAPTRRPRARD